MSKPTCEQLAGATSLPDHLISPLAFSELRRWVLHVGIRVDAAVWPDGVTLNVAPPRHPSAAVGGLSLRRDAGFGCCQQSTPTRNAARAVRQEPFSKMKFLAAIQQSNTYPSTRLSKNIAIDSVGFESDYP